VRFSLGRYEDGFRERLAALTSARAAERIFARDATFWGGDAARQATVANRLGWLDVAMATRSRVGELDQFAGAVRADGFRGAVLLGMGGSSLAPEVLRRSFASRADSPALHVLDTTDAATIGAVVEQIDPARTLVFVSSKSGTTIEALSLLAYFHDLVGDAKGERAGDNFVAITDPGTPLEALAAEHGFRHVFTNPADIGGRYSALSYFGMGPAAAIGVDVAALLDRGIAAAEAERAVAGDGMRLGAALGALALAGKNKATFVVAPPIESFGLWVEQLIAESTGKLGRGIVPVAGEPTAGSDRYGDDRLFVQLRVARHTPAEQDALIDEVASAGHPAIVIDLGDALDLGREFFRWEFAVAVAGQVMGINPFDEPNVQESKDNTSRVLRELEASGRLDADGIDGHGAPVTLNAPGELAEGTVEQEMAKLLGRLSAGDYFAITAYVQPTPSADAAFAEIRAIVRNATRAATTLGYGPRFLHSTGQLHKGGPPQGVFLQVTAADLQDMAIPGRPFTFAQLKCAQAIGDFESLLGHGRPALRVHVGTDVPSGLDALVQAVRAAASRSTGR
jgi:transaldolase/glucose-6-phosphate isomerase